MPSIDELKPRQKRDVTLAKSPERQIIEGDYQSNVGAGTVLGQSQEHNSLAPEALDEQIRRFFELGQP